MNSFSRWGLAFVTLAALAVVGFMAYDAGLARGVEQAGRMTVAASPAVPAAPAAPGGTYAVPYPYPYPYWYRPWGYGHFFGPLIFLFFWMAIARAFFWRGRAYGGCRSSWLDEWHRRAHEDPAGTGPAIPR